MSAGEESKLKDSLDKNGNAAAAAAAAREEEDGEGGEEYYEENTGAGAGGDVASREELEGDLAFLFSRNGNGNGTTPAIGNIDDEEEQVEDQDENKSNVALSSMAAERRGGGGGGKLDPESEAALQDVFALFDHEHAGSIATEELGTVLRGLGYNLTEATIGDLINEYDRDGSGRIDYGAFYAIIVENQPMRGPCTEEQVLADFKCFDIFNDGLISAADLVHLLRELGEPLTQDDVNNLLREITIDGDHKINIRDFVRHMFRSSVA